jgi:hypothetical protein
VAFCDVLERVLSVAPRVDALVLGSDREAFLQRGWVQADGYLTCPQVPFGDSMEEVQVDIDEDAGVFRYASPQQRSRKVVRPLSEIALYSLRMNRFLSDLGHLMGIETRQVSNQYERVPNHLWHLGQMRIAGTHDFAPVFMGRLWARADSVDTTSHLCDPVWPRGGVLFLQQSTAKSLPGAHVVRRLADFIRLEADREVFNAAGFDRVLRGYATVLGEPEPVQFRQGNRLKLPHFTESRELSDIQSKIIKHMWGQDGKAPPVMSWADVKKLVNTAYQSPEDAFVDRARREDVIEKVSRGKYRIRRNP